MVICFNVYFRMIVARFHLNSLSPVFFTLQQQNDCLKWFLSDLPKIRQHRLLRSPARPLRPARAPGGAAVAILKCSKLSWQR